MTVIPINKKILRIIQFFILWLLHPSYGLILH